MNQNSNNRKPLTASSNHYSNRQYFKDNLRVLRKNLLFCSGLPLSLTEQQIRSRQYFGKYGKVLKVIMLKNLRQMSVYVTYNDVYQASLAIIATNDFQIDRYHKLASIYGTIKYCKYFLKKIQCKNMPNCNYLHVYDKKNEIYIDNQLPDQVFEEHYRIAFKLLKQKNLNKMAKQKNYSINTPDDILPCPYQAIKRINSKKILSSAKYIQLGNSDESVCSSVTSNSEDESSLSSQDENQKSQQQTSQTIVQPQPNTSNNEPTFIIQDPLQQQFPKLSISQPLIRKQKQSIPHNTNKKFIQKQKSRQKPKPQLFPALQKQKQQKNQSLQIKLIRKLVRQPKSKLNNWTDYQKSKEQKEQINLFHRQLSQLNQLKQICENNILKQINKEQQRLKFLLIKNIHHKKHHHHSHHCHHHNQKTVKPKQVSH